MEAPAPPPARRAGSLLHVAVAGCGAIARAVHLPLLARHPRVVLVGFADPDSEARRIASRIAPGSRACADLEELLDTTEAEAVVVCLPPAQHAAAARRVLEAGRHLYLEKPLATSLADGAAAVDAWRRSGRVGTIGFARRFNPLYLRLRDQLRRGRIGEPVYLRTLFTTTPKPEPAWKAERASGGGALLDLGSHHLDLIRFLLGRPVGTVAATLSSRRSEEDTALLRLELEGGPSVHAFFSLAAAESEVVEIYGERARLAVSRTTSLEVDLLEGVPGALAAGRRALRRLAALRRLPATLRAWRSPFREPGYRRALDRFVEACLGDSTARADLPDLADGWACLAIVDAAERSARSGAAEPVPLDHPTLGAAGAVTRPVLQ